MSELSMFEFDHHPVRTVLIDEEPWFVAMDVCHVLGISNARDAVARLDDDEKADVGITDVSETQRRKTNIVSESGLYALIFTSIKPEAKRFRKWVTAEVLPALRRKGRYEMPGADDHPTEEWAFWLGVVREARISHGRAAARRLWRASPLPQIAGSAPAPVGQPTEAQAFLSDCIEVTGHGGDRIPAGDLGRHYGDWRRARGFPPVSANAAGRALRAACLAAGIGHIKSGVAMFVGLRLRPD